MEVSEKEFYLTALDRWLKHKVEINMKLYMNTANKEYLGASRAFSETKIEVQKLIQEATNEH